MGAKKISLPKIEGKKLKFMKLLHLLFVSIWTGGTVVSVILLLKLCNTATESEFYNTVFLLKVVARDVILAGGFATVLLGLVYSLFTKWGFVKYRWVLVKWILTVAVFRLTAPMYMNYFDKMQSMVMADGLQALATMPYFNWQFLLIGVQLATILLMFVLSVYKPKLKKAVG